METIKPGDKVLCDRKPATVESVGCEFCRTLVLVDGEGRRFVPATPGKVTKVTE